MEYQEPIWISKLIELKNESEDKSPRKDIQHEQEDNCS
jgi:hypothetical protein